MYICECVGCCCGCIVGMGEDEEALVLVCFVQSRLWEEVVFLMCVQSIELHIHTCMNSMNNII